MLVKGLDGREYKWNFSKHFSRKDRLNKSSIHKTALELLEGLYPHHTIYEELTLPGSSVVGRRGLLYADLFIPSLPLLVEVHGRQHYEYVPFFHKTKMDFAIAKKKDRDKEEWCRLNDITFAVLPYNEIEKWEQILAESIGQ